jgi:hypothetical protein
LGAAPFIALSRLGTRIGHFGPVKIADAAEIALASCHKPTPMVSYTQSATGAGDDDDATAQAKNLL